MRNADNRLLREVTATEPTGADKLIARVRDFNAPAGARASLSEREDEQLRAIEADVMTYTGEIYRRQNGNENFSNGHGLQDLEIVLREWFTLQTESEQRLIGAVEVSTPALESATIRGVVFAKGNEIIDRIEAIEAEIVAAARRRDANLNNEESELLAYLQQDAIAAHLADVLCEAADECARADALYNNATAQAPAPGGEWRFVEAIAAALNLRFVEHKFAGVHAGLVRMVLGRARSKKVA